MNTAKQNCLLALKVHTVNTLNSTSTTGTYESNNVSVSEIARHIKVNC